MAWIESHDDIWEHHKTIRLCHALGISRPQAVGHLHALWHFTLRNAWKDADLSAWGVEEVERIVFWSGEKGVFVAALQQVGFLDDLVVHGWLERAGRLVYDRRRNEKRKKRQISGGKSAVKRRISGGKSEATLPNPTLPNHTQPNPTEQTPPPVPAGAFEIVWEKYPRKLGREEARTKFKAQVKTEKDFQDIQAALDKFIQKIKADRTEEQFIPHGSTWFNNRWRDWIDYRAVDVKPTFVSRPYVEKLPTEDEMVDPKAVQDLLNGIKAARR